MVKEKGEVGRAVARHRRHRRDEWTSYKKPTAGVTG